MWVCTQGWQPRVWRQCGVMLGDAVTLGDVMVLGSAFFVWARCSIAAEREGEVRGPPPAPPGVSGGQIVDVRWKGGMGAKALLPLKRGVASFCPGGGSGWAPPPQCRQG